MLKVEYSNQALKFFKRIDKTLADRILKNIEELRNNPFPLETKKVQGYKEDVYRVRVGNYRVLYEIDKSKNLLGVVKIDHRGQVY